MESVIYWYCRWLSLFASKHTYIDNHDYKKYHLYVQKTIDEK
jgi:hypothetical protein